MSYKSVDNWIRLIEDPRVRRSAIIMTNGSGNTRTLSEAIDMAFSWYSTLECLLISEGFWSNLSLKTKMPGTKATLINLSKVPDFSEFNNRLQGIAAAYNHKYYEL